MLTDDGSDESNWLSAGPSARMTPHQRAEFDAWVGSPEAAAQRSLLERVMARLPLQLAVTDSPLAPGVIAIVRLGHPEPLPRYVIVSSRAFDDDVLVRAQTCAFVYELRQPDDATPVTITVCGDGTASVASEAFSTATLPGRHLGGPRRVSRYAGAVRQALGGIAPTGVPGHDAVRIVDLTVLGEERPEND